MQPQRAVFVSGDAIEGSGGARKVRFAAPGKGKSGGYGVVTFFSGAAVPVFLLSNFSKGDKADLTKSEVNTLRTKLSVLADEYRMRIIP